MGVLSRGEVFVWAWGDFQLETLGGSLSAPQKPLDLLGKSRLQWNLHLLLQKDFPKGSWDIQMHLLHGAV